MKNTKDGTIFKDFNELRDYYRNGGVADDTFENEEDVRE